MREYTAIADILKLVPIEQAIIEQEPGDSKMSVRDKLTWMDCMVNRKPFLTGHDFKILVWETGERIDGYLILSVMKARIRKYSEIRLYRAWRNPDSPDTASEMWDVVRSIADTHRIERIHATANVGLPERLLEKYGFKAVSVNVERRLGNG